MNVFWQPKQECITNKFGKEQAEGKLNHALQRDVTISALMAYNVALRVKSFSDSKTYYLVLSLKIFKLMTYSIKFTIYVSLTYKLHL